MRILCIVSPDSVGGFLQAGSGLEFKFRTVLFLLVLRLRSTEGLEQAVVKRTHDIQLAK